MMTTHGVKPLGGLVDSPAAEMLIWNYEVKADGDDVWMGPFGGDDGSPSALLVIEIVARDVVRRMSHSMPGRGLRLRFVAGATEEERRNRSNPYRDPDN
jgi:hypothetical protein